MGRVMAAKSIIIHVYEDVLVKSNTSQAIYGSLNESDLYGCLCLNICQFIAVFDNDGKVWFIGEGVSQRYLVGFEVL